MLTPSTIFMMSPDNSCVDIPTVQSKQRSNPNINHPIYFSSTLLRLTVIPDNLKEFNKNDTYYIVCAAGSRSAKVVSYLEEQGVHAVNVEGGMNAWGDEGTVIDNI